MQFSVKRADLIEALISHKPALNNFKVSLKEKGITRRAMALSPGTFLKRAQHLEAQNISLKRSHHKRMQNIIPSLTAPPAESSTDSPYPLPPVGLTAP